MSGPKYADPDVQARYAACLAEGCSERLAEMLAERSPPAARTDREFQRNFGTLRDQLSGNDRMVDSLVKTARAHGGNPGASDIYQPSLAAFPGDPRAFVSTKGEIKKLCEERDQDCLGTVEHRRVKDPAPARKKRGLAKDLVDRHVRRLVAREPALALKPAKELRERVVSERSVKITELD